MKIRLLITLLISFAYDPAMAQRGKASTDSFKDKELTPVEMQSDFRYLRAALEETHPGLYRYNSKEGMAREMDSLYALLDKPVKYYDFYRILAVLIADIRCAHTTVFPGKNLGNLFSSFQLFPFGVIYIDNQVYLTLNTTADTSVKPGFELLSINGRPIDSINSLLFRHIWCDGYVETWKRRILVDQFFAVFYYLFIDQPDHFTFTYKNNQGEVLTREVPPVSGADFNRNLTRNPVNAMILKNYGPRSRLNQKKGWRVEVHKELDAAVMTIRGFGGGGNADGAAKKMHDFMEASMKKIKESKVRNLIIDLRDNRGGWDNQGEVLYTYLIDSPSYYYRRFHAVTDSSEFLQFSSISKEELGNIKNELIPESDGTFTVKEQYNSTLAMQYPEKNRFTGKIYFLVNGGSASTTAEFAAVARSHGVGVFVGEETAGNYTGGNGGEFIALTLPKTRIQVQIPLLYYDNAVRPPAREGRGTIPDYVVPYNIKDVLSGTDTQLNFVYGLIGKMH